MSISPFNGKRSHRSKNSQQGVRRQIKSLWEDLPENLVQIDGMPARLESVRLSDLNIPTDYQRNYDSTWGNRLAREYDFTRHDPMRVSRRADGSLWVMDGQHRTNALRLRLGPKGDTPVMVHVFEALTLEQEARLYLQWNSNIRRATKSHTFNAEVKAGNKRAIEVERVANAYGYRINRHSSAKNGQLLPNPLMDLDQVIRVNGISALEESVAIIADAFADRTNHIQAGFMKAIGDFVETYYGHPDYSHDRFVKVLRTIDIDQFVAEQKAGMKYVEDTRAKMKISGRRLLLGVYNKRLQNPLPPKAA